MHKTNLEERVIVKLGRILQSRNTTKEDVLAAYAEAECGCIKENNNNEEVVERCQVSNCLW
jgi:hypothetical protein